MIQNTRDMAADVTGAITGGMEHPAAAALMRAIDAGVVVLDRNLHVCSANAIGAAVLGASTASLPLGATLDRVAPSLVQQAGDRLVLALGGDRPMFEFCADDLGDLAMPRQWRIELHPLPAHGRDAGGIILLARPAATEAMRASEVLFRSVVESAPNGLAMVNAAGRIVLVNSKMELLFGYGRRELLSMSVDQLLPRESMSSHASLRATYTRAPTARDMAERRELYARRKDDSVFAVEVGLRPVETSRGTHTLAAVVDVTEHKTARRALEGALREKTALLNEVHHRVKNNLQVISSLLSLQARNVTPEARRVLADSQSRVKAMALTHQLLYERSDFSSLDLDAYIERLASLLRDTYGEPERRIDIRTQTHGGAVRLDLQRAMPCALLVSELVANAFKHAFPDGRSGTIWMRLRRPATDLAEIEVEDDGVGLPPAEELERRKSLGFQLMTLLADQIGGAARFTVGAGGGCRVTVSIPLDAEAAA